MTPIFVDDLLAAPAKRAVKRGSWRHLVDVYTRHNPEVATGGCRVCPCDFCNLLVAYAAKPPQRAARGRP